MAGTPPSKRAYVHDECKGTTIVSGDDFISLVDPFSGVTLTVCAACRSTRRLEEFRWADTGENMVEARTRHAGEFPAAVRFVNSWTFYFLFMAICGAGLACTSPLWPKHVGAPWLQIGLFFVGAFVGLILYFGFLARPITNAMMGAEYDVRNLK